MSEILTPEQIQTCRDLLGTIRRVVVWKPADLTVLLDSHEALRAARDRLAAEVAQLTADLESHDVETQRRIATLTREFNVSYARHVAENDRLRAAATVVLQGLRGDEKGEFWSARKWLDDSDIFHGDINGLRVLEEVLRAALAPTPAREEGQ